jgi:hypothetical protein
LKVSRPSLLTPTAVRWGVIAGTVVSVGVAVALYVLLAGWVHENTCYELLPAAPDSVGLIAREEPELMAALNAEYASSRKTIPGVPPVDDAALPKPLRVTSISGKTATVVLAGAASDANFMYAAAWSRVWGSHHGKPASSAKFLPA